jgi:hypothetical protein
VPKRRRRRGSRLWTLIWLGSMLGSLALAGSLGTAAAVSAEEEPPPEETFEASESPTDEPTEPPIQCEGVGDSTGPLPAGTQAISGTLTDGGGDPVDGIEIRITSNAGGKATTFTTPTGEWQVGGLGDATYQVAFFDGNFAAYQSGFYVAGGPLALTPATATPIVLSGTGAPGIDAVLPAETFQSLSGTVTDSLANPLGSVRLSAISRYFPIGNCAASASNGTYSIPSLRVGSYLVRADRSGLPTGFYESTTGFTDDILAATQVAVTTDTTGIDIQFPPTHSLSGVVLDGDGLPVDDIGVTACKAGNINCTFAASGGGTGAFELTGLTAGSYFIREQDISGLNRYLSGYYAGENTFSMSVDDAVAVPVPGGPIQLLVEAAPQVTGTIDNLLGDPVADASVSLCDVEQENCFSGVTDSFGAYAIGVTVPGAYVAQVFDGTATYPSGGYITASGTIVRDIGSALEVVVGGVSVTGVDGTLPDGGRISLTLLAGGSPVQFASVEFCLSEFVCPDGGGTDFDGLAESPVMFADTYYVKAHNAEFTAEYWYVSGDVGSTDFDDATAVNVTAGSTSGITVEIPVAGTPTPEGDPVITLDDGSGTNPITMSFTDVEAGGGVTNVDVTGSGAPPPSGFQLGVPATYYDFTTTATFDQVQICITYTGVGYIDEANLRLFHFDDLLQAWEDITDVGQPDTVNDSICGTSDSLSPFVLAERSYQFSGFHGPKAPPKLNDVKAGDTVGLQFGLGGDLGLSVLAAGSPAVRQLNCTTLVFDLVAQDAVGTLKFRKGTYTYTWVTLKAWKNTCREISVTFKDGTTASVWYRFR